MTNTYTPLPPYHRVVGYFVKIQIYFILDSRQNNSNNCPENAVWTNNQNKLMDFLSGLKSVLIVKPEFGLKNMINS